MENSKLNLSVYYLAKNYYENGQISVELTESRL